ncbi:MAG: hypothetical protein ACK5JF_00475 [Oscillospiraceae bacterium]
MQNQPFRFKRVEEAKQNNCCQNDAAFGWGYCALFEQDTTYQYNKAVFTRKQAEGYIHTYLNNMGQNAQVEICRCAEDWKIIQDKACGIYYDESPLCGLEILYGLSLCSVQLLRSPYDTGDTACGAVFYLRTAWSAGLAELLVLQNRVLAFHPYSGRAQHILWHTVVKTVFELSRTQ